MRRQATRRDLAVLTLAALALLAATSVFEWSRADDASSWDVPLYQSFGDRIVDGEVPYRDFRVEYPPGSLPAFVLPSLVAGDGDRRLRARAERRCRELRTVVRDADDAAARGDRRLHGALARRAPRDASAHAAVALGLVAATPLLLGELALTRFDALPVALTAAVARGAPPRPLTARGGRARSRGRGEALSAAPRAARRDLRPAAHGSPGGRRERRSDGRHGRRRRAPVPRARAPRGVVLDPGAADARPAGREPARATSRWRSTPPRTGSASARWGRGSRRVARARCGAPTSRARSGRSSGLSARSPQSSSSSRSGSPRGGGARPRAARARRRDRRRRPARARPRALAAVPALARAVRPARRRSPRPARERPARGRARRRRTSGSPTSTATTSTSAACPRRPTCSRATGCCSRSCSCSSRRAAFAEEPDGGEEDERRGDRHRVGGLGPDRHDGHEQHRERSSGRRDGGPPAPRAPDRDGDDTDEEPRPERRVELRRAVHLQPEPGARPAVGEGGEELGLPAVVREPARSLRGVVELEHVHGRRASRPRGCSRRASRSARSGARTGRPRPRSAPAERRRGRGAGCAPGRPRRLQARRRARRRAAARALPRARRGRSARTCPDARGRSRARRARAARSPSPSPSPGRRGRSGPRAAAGCRARRTSRGRRRTSGTAPRCRSSRSTSARELARRTRRSSGRTIRSTTKARKNGRLAWPPRDDREVVVAPEVRHRPAAEQRDGDAGEGQRPPDPDPPASREGERHDRDDEERLVDGTGERDERRRRTERGEAPGRRRQRGPHGERRPDREPGGEDDLARELVEERAVAGIEEERDGDEHRRARARRAAPCACGGASSPRRAGRRTPRRASGLPRSRMPPTTSGATGVRESISHGKTASALQKSA